MCVCVCLCVAQALTGSDESKHPLALALRKWFELIYDEFKDFRTQLATVSSESAPLPETVIAPPFMNICMQWLKLHEACIMFTLGKAAPA